MCAYTCLAIPRSELSHSRYTNLMLCSRYGFMNGRWCSHRTSTGQAGSGVGDGGDFYLSFKQANKLLNQQNNIGNKKISLISTKQG